MSGQTDGYYRLALLSAMRRDLSGATEYARHALRVEPANERARMLLALCLYETGELFEAYEHAKQLERFDAGELKEAIHAEFENLQSTFEHVGELVQRKKWRESERIMSALPRQSVKILNIRGCLLASAGKHAKAGKIFAEALEADRGNTSASVYLTEAVKRGRKIWFFMN